MKRLIVILGLSALLSGCATVEYLAQAVGGHLELMRLSLPIKEQLDDATKSGALRAKLARVLAIREFASRELDLPDNGSYRRYADIGRPYVVWNVFAAPEFSVKPVESCFPFTGCVTYRGYYSESAARKHAGEMSRKGYDVHVGGVPAYSTLGWFDDPVLSTFIQYPEAEIARLLFHELAHQVLYVKNDTKFNESFAVTVEQEGVRRWLERAGTPSQREAYEVFRQRRQEFIALVLKYRNQLDVFYRQPGSGEEKRAGKARLFGEMRSEYEKLKASWGGFAGYDRFFDRPPNNALLASVAIYTELVPGFHRLLEANGTNLGRFYAAARRLSAMPEAERLKALGEHPVTTSTLPP